MTQESGNAEGFDRQGYLPMVVWAGMVAVLLLGFAFFPKSADWYGWIQAVGLVVGLMVAISVPAIQRKQEFQEQGKQRREREVGYARRLPGQKPGRKWNDECSRGWTRKK